MHIQVLVVAFHGDLWLRACIATFRESVEPNTRIIIADNHGNTITSSLVDENNIAIVSLPGPLGFAEANNQALVKSSFDTQFICFLNQDTKSPSGWLTQGAKFLDQHPDIGALTPLISTYDGEGWDPNFVDCTRPLVSFWEELAQEKRESAFYEVPVIPAPAMVVRTDILKAVGGFDPIYGSYYEDYDLCHRIRQAGYRVGIWTGATVAHFSGSATSTPEAERRRQRQIVRNRIIYRVRTAERRRLRQLGREVLVELPRQLARRLLGRPASKPLAVLLGGYWDAAKIIHRLLSASLDERIWRAYLTDIGWPTNER